MPGGLMQLISYGAEDLYLTGNPQITFFKYVYRRHTNFANEYIENLFDPQPSFSTTERSQGRVKVDRHGDLLYDNYLIYTLPNVNSFPQENFQWVRNIGHRIIHYVEITVDGQKIDKQYGRWMDIWGELTTTDSKRFAYDRLIGNNYYKLRPRHGNYYPDKGNNITIPSTELLIPFHFWFCDNPGLAIPLIALQYTEIYFNIEFNELNELFTFGRDNLSPCAFFSKNNDDPLKCTLEQNGWSSQNIFWKFVNRQDWNQFTFILSNYIYLDTDERRKFAQTSHEYLIHQVQFMDFNGLKSGQNTREFFFFHPTKELIWTLQNNRTNLLNDWNNYTFVDQFHDYNNLKLEYINKFDFLNQPSDTAFLQNTNSFITDIETQPQICDQPFFLGNNLSKTLAFNDYTNILLSAKLKFNGNDRFEERSHSFFNFLQPYKYHTHSAREGIYVYSFALNPEIYQPSGTCNFSRIQRSELCLNIRKDICDPDDINSLIINSYTLRLYGLNYNVFRILGGIGSIVFQ